MNVEMTPKSECEGESIVCPYCGYEDEDSWAYGEADTEYECPNCGKTSELEVCVSIIYTTRPLEAPNE